MMLLTRSRWLVAAGITALLCLVAGAAWYMWGRHSETQFDGLVITADRENTTCKILVLGDRDQQVLPRVFTSCRAVAVAGKAKEIFVLAEWVLYVLSAKGDLIREDSKLLSADDEIFSEQRQIIFMSVSSNGEHVAFLTKEGDLSDSKFTVFIRLLAKNNEAYGHWTKISLQDIGSVTIAIAPDGGSFVYGTQSNDVGIYYVNTGSTRWIGKGRNPLLSMDGSMVSCVLDDSVRIIDVSSGDARIIKAPRAHLAALSPDSKYVAVQVWSPFDFVVNSQIDIMSVSSGTVIKSFAGGLNMDSYLGWIAQP